MSAPAEAGPRRRVGAPLLSGVVVVAIVAGVLLGWVVFGARAPDGDSVDAGFARDMKEHHAQAVDMSLTAVQAGDDRQVDTLAWDITTTQSNQIGIMETWLRDWDLPLARSGDRMAWMGGMDAMADMDMSMEASPGDPDYRAMPGMATKAEMEQLRAAQGDEAEVMFLQLMLTHHLAGVQMAQAALDDAQTSKVRDLAQRMVDGQRGEVELMADMLTDRDAQPREDLEALGY